MIEETLLEAGEKMDKAVEVAKEDFASIRTGCATPGLYNKVLVDYYGPPTPLQQLASFAVPDARHHPHHALRQDRPARHRTRAERPGGRRQPPNDGNVIRITIPDLTQERRKEYVKSSSPRARTPRCPSATSAARPRKPGQAGQGRRGRGRGQPRRKGTGCRDQGHVDGIDELLKRKEAELLEV